MAKKKIPKNVVLYHNHCDDGIGSAWAAWNKFGNKAKYIGVFHSEPFPKEVRGANVYMLDIAYPKEKTKELLKIANSLVIVDHHISSKDSIKLADDYLYDDKFKESGATLSWKYFHPDKKTPKLLEYIKDRDLWRWKLPYSKEFTAYMRSQKQDFKSFSQLAKGLENAKTRKKYFDTGKVILDSEDKKVQNALDSATLVEFSGYKVLVSNSFHFVSQLGHALYKKHPHFGIIWSYKKNYIKVSLRSDGKVDVSKLAAKFGGGGHKASAGFELPFGSKLPWKFIKKSS